MTGPPDLAADPRHIALAFAVAASFARRFPPLADEFESECLVALCQAARSYDPGRGVRFSTHAANRIRGALLDVQREWTPCGYRRRGNEAPDVDSIDAPTATGEDGRPLALAETLASGDGPVGWEEEYQDELRGYARRTAKGTGEALVRLYGRADTATMERVGASLGLSESRVSQRLATGMADLGDRFGGTTPGEIIMAGTVRFTKAELLKGVTVGGHDYDEEIAAANGHATAEVVAKAAGAAPPPPSLVNRSCARCGRVYGMTRRCYGCNPARGRKGETGRDHARAVARGAAVPAMPAFAALSLEINAVRAVADAIAGLDVVSARRVLDWVASHLEDAGPGDEEATR